VNKRNNPTELIVDENVNFRADDQIPNQLQKMGVAISSTVMVADQWSGAPDSAILEELERRGAMLLTKDRTFHNTVLAAGRPSYCILEDGNITRKRIKGFPSNPILPGRGNLTPAEVAPESFAIRTLVVDPTDERALKKQRTKRRRIRNKVGGLQNIDHLAITVTANRGLIGLVVQVVSNTGVPGFKGSEAFIRAPEDAVGSIAIIETLALLLRLHLETCKIIVFYDTNAGIHDPVNCDDSLFVALAAAFPRIDWIECSKGRHIEWLRETTRKLRNQPTNMITCSEISTFQLRLAEQENLPF
jgi:predicted nuclease of predicted toxin-antitoxin system